MIDVRTLVMIAIPVGLVAWYAWHKWGDKEGGQ